MDSLSELLEDQVKDIYNAENQLSKALPRMAKKASSPELKAAFTNHLKETLGHIDRMAKVAQILGIKPTGMVCKAMKGLIEEGKEVLEEDGHPAVIDAALIVAAQRCEHYEMAAYGGVKAIATVLGKKDLVALFDATLKEEEAADAKLTTVAESAVYPKAPKTEEDGEAEEDEDAPTAKASKKTAKAR